MSQASATRRKTSYIELAAVDLLLLLVVIGVVGFTWVALYLARVEPAANFQRQFWAERVDELCDDGFKKLAPSLPRGTPGDPLSQIGALSTFEGPIRRVWALHFECEEPRVVEIPEDLLHFKTAMANEFEESPQRGYRAILAAVDEFRAQRPEIVVIGFTDDRGTNDHNDQLSFNRALHVRDKIEEHLRGKGLVHGKDYMLWPVGRGETAQAPRMSNESDEAWYKRNRKIEIEFRAPRRERKEVAYTGQ